MRVAGGGKLFLPSFQALTNIKYTLRAICNGRNDDDCRAKRIEKTLWRSNNFTPSADIGAHFALIRAEQGGLSAGRTLDTFFRMVYLSAVTLTTVGYGDIVPLTDWARTAVAGEAIVGIVLIGLFLNALSKERD